MTSLFQQLRKNFASPLIAMGLHLLGLQSLTEENKDLSLYPVFC